MKQPTRRQAIALGGAYIGAAGTLWHSTAQTPAVTKPGKADDLFKISLAQWSLHRALYAKKSEPNYLPPLLFPVMARREFGIDAIEYVNAFYQGKARNKSYLNELNDICDGEGVSSLLIMCDGEGRLGDPDPNARKDAIENHHKWADMAAHLGCHAIRVNAYSGGSFEDQQRYSADGLNRLAEYTSQYNISVIVENHGEWSSHGAWLAGVMELADNQWVGTLPDFGNFRYGEEDHYDPYQGVAELMPFAKGVSAKSFDFAQDGRETHFDYERMLRIVLDAGFRGYVGIEYEGHGLTEPEGIRKTKALLERVRETLSPEYI